MKHHDPNHGEPQGYWVAVPQLYLDRLLAKQEQILELLQGKIGSQKMAEYLTEAEAMEMLGRKSTWFWGMRTKRKLAFTKVGNRIFYAKSDILNLLNSHRKEAVTK